MPMWAITYQDTPYAYTSSATLLVEAEDVVGAVVTAFDALTRRGNSVYTHLIVPEGCDMCFSVGGLDFMGADAQRLLDHGVPTSSTGYTHFRKVEPYAVKVTGRVVQG